MKKVSLIGVSLFLVVSLSGCGEPKDSEIRDLSETVPNTTDQSQMESKIAEDTAEGEGNLINKLKNAISSGKKMKCTYKMGDENNATEIITYLQGDKYKTEIVMGQMKTLSVFDGESMYSWVSEQKTGTKMTMDCINSLDTKGETEAETVPENVPTGDEDDFVETLSDAQNLNCEDFQDADFDIPSDVVFTDQCELLKSQQKMIEGLNK